MLHPIKHFKTITKHRHLVIKNCFKAGIGFQGLFHDLSKYTPAEFLPSIKYYTGEHSPLRDERLDKGYSLAWMHHKGRNKHHYEYWSDIDPYTKKYVPIPMPDNYIKEMFCDRIAASRVYNGEKYTNRSALEYLENEKKVWVTHPDTEKKITFLLEMVAEKGENYTLRYLRNHKTL